VQMEVVKTVEPECHAAPAVAQIPE